MTRFKIKTNIFEVDVIYNFNTALFYNFSHEQTLKINGNRDNNKNYYGISIFQICRGIEPRSSFIDYTAL